MGSVSSEDEVDQPSDRFEFDSYSFSADVSESESSSGFSCRHYDCSGGASTSLPSLAAGGFFSRPSLPIMLPVVDGNHVMIPMKKEQKQYTDLCDAGMMKERFAKLLLGEDMSGGGNGVCTALAISNAITNLSASVFGELWKLEPLAPQKKSMWHQEMELFLCISNYIVELVPSIQEFPGGGTFDIMVPRPRLDLFVNLPALKKLDGMLLNILDGFHDSEFYYVDRGLIVAGGNETKIYPVSSSSSISCEEKWWLPFPKVPRNGLSGHARKRLQQSKECASQIFKDAMAINDSVLAEMETPNAYLASLPKSGKACLGENIYREITANRFSPDSLLDYLDLSSEYSTLEIANRIEAASHIWRKKCVKGDNRGRSRAGKRSTWGGRIRGFVGEVERNELLARRAEAVLHSLRLRFPALPQTILDMHKIQYNKDVGYAIIESYSRVMESLAFNIMARIDDLLYVDDATKQRAAAESISLYDQGGAIPKQKHMSLDTFSSQHSFPAPSLQVFDSCHEKSRIPNSRTHHFRKRNRLRDSPIQALQKLTF